MNPQSDKDPRNLEHWEESEVPVFSIESTSDSTIAHTKNYESSKAICESQCSVFQIDNPMPQEQNMRANSHRETYLRRKPQAELCRHRKRQSSSDDDDGARARLRPQQPQRKAGAVGSRKNLRYERQTYEIRDLGF